MEKKVLFIAYVFPPIVYGGTHRTIRLCKYLEKIGYTIDVLTIKIQKDLHNDFNLLSKISEKTTVHRTSTIDIWRLYNRKLKNILLKKTVGKFIDKIISFPIECVNKPDHMVFWVPFAVVKGYQIIKNRRIKAIYTTSPPHSQLITGILLKKMTGVKWIADLRDPITFNIASENWGFIARWVNSSLDRLTMKNADVVIANTEAASNAIKAIYPQKDIIHIPNTFDEDDFEKLCPDKYPEFTISHVGTIYRFRNAEPLFQAVADLHNEGVIEPSKFTIKFVGLNDKALNEKVARYGLQSYVKLISMVEHSEAIEIMRKSHMLLLIKGFNSNGMGQIPGKLYEYIGSRNPILYIGPKKSELSEIIEDTNSGYIVGNDFQKIRNIIFQEYTSFTSQNSRIGVSQQNHYHKKYTSGEMARKFDIVFRSLH